MRIALGTAQFGMNYGINNKKGKISEEEAFKILEYASGNHCVIDAASAYGDSEKIIGRFIKKNNADLKIVTKLSLKDNIKETFQESLVRLNINKLYGCLVHDFENFKENKEKFEELRELKKQGKVDKIGFSLYYPEEAEYLLDKEIEFDILQIPFSIFDQRFSSVLDRLKAKGVEIHVRSVFLQGLVFKDPNELESNFIGIKDKLFKLDSIAKESGVSISSLCINFAALSKHIDSIVVGVDDLENFKENLGTLNHQDKVKKVYDELKELKEDDENIILPINWKKTMAIIQARMGSTRFPGKMMELLAGKPLIWHVIDRVKKSKKVDKVILATGDNESNKILAKEVSSKGVDCFFGDEEDVLDRFYQCAKKFNAGVIVRITGDCPLIDPLIIDEVVELFKKSKADYASNVRPHTYPDGMDVEVFLFDSLEKAWKEAKLKSEREHVTPYIWKNKEMFNIVNLENNEDLSDYRITIDEKEDLLLIEEIIKKIGKDYFTMEDIMNLLRKNPELNKINEKFSRNEGYVKSIKDDEAESSKGCELWKKAKKFIPGGTQLLTKRSEMFLPEKWPSYFKKAKGVEVEDLDGNKYIDMSIMGVGSCVLGYADDDVNEAVKKVIDEGSMCTLNSKEEVELAELLVKIHPWAQQVRYTRSGGEAMAVAIRIARAASGKEKLAFCGYHGWHDWYLSCNLDDDKNLDGHLLPGLKPKGIPRGLIKTAIPFEYNNIKKLKEIVKNNEIGVIVVEPYRHEEPKDDFLKKIKEIADEINAVLVFDEITCGWRNNLGGVHLTFGVTPDMVVYAKGMGNGYPIGVVLGKKKVMEAAQETFVSSTSWTERVGPAAAIATINKMKAKNASAHIDKIGGLIGVGWKKIAEKHGLNISVVGPNSLITFSFKYDNAQELKTLFIQEMLKRGFLASTSVYVSYSHKEEYVKKYLEAVDEVFAMIKKAISDGNVKDLLEGPVAHTGFRRLVD